MKHALCRGQALRSVQSRVDVFLYTYRHSVHSMMQETPAFCMYGRQLRSRLDLLQPCTAVVMATNVHSFTVDWPVFVRDYLHQQKWVSAAVIRVFRPANYLVCTSVGLTWKRHVKQLLSRGSDHSYTADSVPLFDVSSSIDMPVITSLYLGILMFRAGIVA